MGDGDGRGVNGLVATGQVRDSGNPFALPLGMKGRLAGWYMAFPDAQHRELVELILDHHGTRLLEIGFGPGQLLTMLHRRSPRLELCGADPSELMIDRARRHNPVADLRLGAAAAIPFPDEHADVVVSVNNLPMWPDLDAGLQEVRRVLTPDGTALLAWHGGHDPRGHQRRLVLPPDRLHAIDAALRSHFADVSSQVLRHSQLWQVSS